MMKAASMLSIFRRRVRIVPTYDAQLLGRINSYSVWQSKVGDPQFVLRPRSNLMPGRYEVELDVAGIIAPMVRPKLYFDYGEGFSERNAITLSFKPRYGGKAVAKFQLKKNCREIRFDPTSEAGIFFLRPKIKLSKLSGLEIYIGTTLEILREKPLGSNAQLARYVWNTYRKSGFSGIAKDLNGYGLPATPQSADLRLHVNDADFIFLDKIDLPSQPSSGSVGVHVHLYYPDLAKEFANYLSRVPRDFSLYVSVPNAEAEQLAKDAFSKLTNISRLDIRILPNRGRDIAPFVVEFASELRQFDIVGHIQTKKSLYNDGATTGWREYILNSLFESSQSIEKIFSLLESKQFGMVYPQCFPRVPYVANTWLANLGIAHAWMERLGLEQIPAGYFDFPVGSMFWARRDAIDPLLSAGISLEDFPKEEAQTDGTLAHCIERMLGVVPASRGFALGILPDLDHPSWSKWRLEQFTNRTLEDIKSQIADPKRKLIAFDIFDTLLIRPHLDPDFVKSVLADEAHAQGFDGFRPLRTAAEQDARRAKGSDVSIHEIYHEMRLREPGLPITAEREISLETYSVRKRSQVAELLDFAKKRSKRVVLASDMFLPREAIETMLTLSGIAGWDELYLSSEIGGRKDSGKLYSYLLEKEGLKASEVLMIGDNERSDFQIPIDLGFGAIHLMSPVAFMRGLPIIARKLPARHDANNSSQTIFGLIAHKLYSDISYRDWRPTDGFGRTAYEIGYAVLGPLVTSFSQWLLENSTAKQLSTLHFLAREGKFLKTAFDTWTAKAVDAPKSNYLIVSRRAVSVPAIRSMDDILSIASSNNFYDNTLKVFLLERYGLTLDVEMEAKLVEKGLWSKEKLVSIRDGDISSVTSILNELEPEIMKNASLERSDMLAYLNASGLCTSERQAVVDVGYSATIQKFIMRMTSQKVDGLYFATEQTAARVAAENNVSIEGYFAENIKKSPHAPPVFLHSFLLEKMLSADDPQVLKYQAGKPVFRELRPAELDAREVRHEVQRGALDFVADAGRLRDEIMPGLRFAPEDALVFFNTLTSEFPAEARDFLSRVSLDDDYCGRGVVS